MQVFLIKIRINEYKLLFVTLSKNLNKCEHLNGENLATYLQESREKAIDR